MPGRELGVPGRVPGVRDREPEAPGGGQTLGALKSEGDSVWLRIRVMSTVMVDCGVVIIDMKGILCEIDV